MFSTPVAQVCQKSLEASHIRAALLNLVDAKLGLTQNKVNSFTHFCGVLNCMLFIFKPLSTTGDGVIKFAGHLAGCLCFFCLLTPVLHNMISFYFVERFQ